MRAKLCEILILCFLYLYEFFRYNGQLNSILARKVCHETVSADYILARVHFGSNEHQRFL